MISISTMGKFAGPPTKEAASQYGGGSTAPPIPPKQHKFPKIKITSLDKSEEDINIHITSIEENDHD